LDAPLDIPRLVVNQGLEIDSQHLVSFARLNEPVGAK
jgi:hypothetical protein